jgi:hypothetical protein
MLATLQNKTNGNPLNAWYQNRVYSLNSWGMADFVVRFFFSLRFFRFMLGLSVFSSAGSNFSNWTSRGHGSRLATQIDDKSTQDRPNKTQHHSLTTKTTN